MTAPPVPSQTLTLSPFCTDPASPNITLTGIVKRSPDNQLTLIYDVRGDIAALHLPSSELPPQRQDNLWETTCFECFIGQPQKSHYWEINLSPNRNWNVFTLSDYRKDIQETSQIGQVNVITNETDHREERFTLVAQLSLDPFVPIDCEIELSLTAVIQDKQNNCTYWAVSHRATEPDFHQRSSFIIQL
jgi:hypothetical protein